MYDFGRKRLGSFRLPGEVNKRVFAVRFFSGLFTFEKIGSEVGKHSFFGRNRKDVGSEDSLFTDE